jgi:hypothetical protein
MPIVCPSRQHGACIMERIYFLMFGAALILSGVFGLVETAIRFSSARTPAKRPVAEAIESPSLAPTDEDLELVVVRERETNPDGTPRQEIIRELAIGDAVALEPERPRDDGREEIKVVADGGTIGYVPSAKVSRVLDLLSDGAQIHSEVSHIAETGEERGVWINVSVWR